MFLSLQYEQYLSFIQQVNESSFGPKGVKMYYWGLEYCCDRALRSEFLFYSLVSLASSFYGLHVYTLLFVGHELGSGD